MFLIEIALLLDIIKKSGEFIDKGWILVLESTSYQSDSNEHRY